MCSRIRSSLRCSISSSLTVARNQADHSMILSLRHLVPCFPHCLLSLFFFAFPFLCSLFPVSYLFFPIFCPAHSPICLPLLSNSLMYMMRTCTSNILSLIVLQAYSLIVTLSILFGVALCSNNIICLCDNRFSYQVSSCFCAAVPRALFEEKSRVFCSAVQSINQMIDLVTVSCLSVCVCQSVCALFVTSRFT